MSNKYLRIIHLGDYPTEFINACIKGNLEDVTQFLKLEKNKMRPFHGQGLGNACRYGHLDIAKLIYSKYSDITLSVECGLELVYGGGHVNVLKWIYEKCPDIDKFEYTYHRYLNMFEIAINKGNLKAAKLIYEHKKNVLKDYVGGFRIYESPEVKNFIEELQLSECGDGIS